MKKLTYQETLNYMFAQLPMYQRIGAAAYKANLDNTYALMDVLQHPYQKFKSIHVAGTNGKGSTSHMLAAILQCSGYKVGLYTSPHLKDFRERIRVNGKMVSKNYVTDFVEQNKKHFEKIKPSFFEMTVGLAFNYFAYKKVDIAIIETGLGGRLDSTNVITPELSIITNISYDHTNLLGKTMQKIATEKAGIIKPDGLVIVGEHQPETAKIFEKAAKKNKATLVFASEVFNVKVKEQAFIKNKLMLKYDIFPRNSRKTMGTNLPCDLAGTYQAKNIATVTLSCMTLDTFTGIRINWNKFDYALSNTVDLTGLQGRWQVLQKKPLVIADIGHNEAGIAEVVKNIKVTPHKKLHFILGVVKDKDIASMLKLLPKKASYYFCKSSIPRALPEQDLTAKAAKYGLKGSSWPTVKKALQAALLAASKDDLIIVGGSAFTVAETL